MNLNEIKYVVYDLSNKQTKISGPTPKKQCSRGKPVECGQHIRFEHTTTSRNLHSHHFGSPLSNAQEVSAFGDEGKKDTRVNYSRPSKKRRALVRMGSRGSLNPSILAHTFCFMKE